jgi:RNA polymerase sigma-70 factor (ECF subfamily)
LPFHDDRRKTDAMAREEDGRSDGELLAAVIAHEPGSWHAFYRRYERVIIGCVRNALRRYQAFFSDEDVEDIVNTVCLNLVKDDYKKLRTFDAGRGYRLSSWIGLIATNTTLDALRRRDPTHTALDADEALQQEVADRAGSPRDLLERRQQWQALVDAIRALPEVDQRFIELYYDDELSPEEIAVRLGITVNTVYSRKNKVREKLRKLLDPDRESERSGKVRDDSA